MSQRSLHCFLVISLILVSSTLAFADDLEMLNRPVNTSGLTGLLFTTSPYTLPLHTLEIGVGALSENSTIPSYTITQLPSMSVTYGIRDNMELAVKSSFYRETLNPSGDKLRGAGNTELSYKWNFLPQTESSSMPALAVIVTGIAPTSSKDITEDNVVHWGARMGLSAGREIILGEHVLGVYADGSVVVHDLSDDNLRDRYELVDAGLLLPISKYRNLQLLLEYNRSYGIDKMTVSGGDYSGMTYGLRLVTEGFNITIGTQFIRKETEGFDNSNRVIGMMSYKF